MQAAEKGGTKNVEAHEAYLQGRFFLNRHSEKETDQARAAYERAVQLDPNFALAWAGLAQTHVWDCNMATEGGQKGFNAHLATAREAVERALALEPDLPEALYRARRSKPISIITGKERTRHCAKLSPWLRRTRRY